MSGVSPHLSVLKCTRRRLFLLPREHGAWGMLLVPLVTGAAVASPAGKGIVWILLFAAVALGLFFLRTPLEAALGISALRPQNEAERKLVHRFIYFYASVSGLSFAVLYFWAHADGLLLIGAIAAIAFLFQTELKQLGPEMRVTAQLTGAIALSSTAAGAYYLAKGHFGPVAAVIWLANWLFAADQIHFVQIRIHSARARTPGERFQQGKGFLAHQAACLLLLVLMWRAGWFPGLILLAFAPLFIRGMAWFLRPSSPLQVRRLGVRELEYAVVFALVFVAFYPR